MKNILIFTLFYLVINGCFNPFFPETGTPPQVESSPARTIQLLKEAYEQKDIGAFESLIYSTEDFSSYTQVADNYTSSLNRFLFLPKVFIDTIFTPNFMPNRFLQSNRYYYELRWEQEHRIHRRMFNTDEIVFLQPFFAGETLYEISNGDTVSALVKTANSQIRIRYGGEDIIVDVTGQIFVMRKINAAWKIWKWIELN